MPDKTPTAPEGVATPQGPQDLSAQVLSKLQELSEKQEQDRAEFREFRDEFGRTLERLSLDVKVAREHLRREAGVGPYRRPPVPPDTETDGNGHTTYPWKQRPATPRPG